MAAEEPRIHDIGQCRATFCRSCFDTFIPHNNVGPSWNDYMDRNEFPRCLQRCGYPLVIRSTVTWLPRAQRAIYEQLQLQLLL